VTPLRVLDDDHDARLRAEQLPFARYRTSGDPREREQLIERHLPLARRLARRYAGAQEPVDDLMQAACRALVKAIDRFDPERCNAFTSYAVPTIVGELRRYYRDHPCVVRTPRELHELSLRIEQTWSELAAKRGHAPTVGELAVRLDTDDEAVLDALASDGHSRVDPGYELAENRELAAGLLASLEPHERRIVHLRFHLGLTQSEIGRRVGLSQMSVSRILRGSLERLRAAADA
jgi:RNA polymerase sigma-B factor